MIGCIAISQRHRDRVRLFSVLTPKPIYTLFDLKLRTITAIAAALFTLPSLACTFAVLALASHVYSAHSRPLRLGVFSVSERMADPA
eukprot:2148589-Pleurochrysis_carterae.AAC.1